MIQISQIDQSWRILMTGVTSIHGWPLYQKLQKLVLPENLFAIRSPKMKIPQGPQIVPLCVSDRDGLQKIKEQFNPTHVIQCSGVCDLDVCEERPHWAYQINTEGARAVTDTFGRDCYYLFASADLVFSGENTPSGGYTEESVPNPVSIAGKTFFQAEKIFLSYPRSCVARLGLPIGDSLTGDKGAQDFIDYRFRRGLPMTLFYDEYRSCIDCKELSDALLFVLTNEITGILHAGGPVPSSLFRIGEYVIRRGNYQSHLLKGIMRKDEVNGPPRMGDVSLNSSVLCSLLGKMKFRDPIME